MDYRDNHIVGRDGRIFLVNKDRYALTYLAYVGSTCRKALFITFCTSYRRRVDRLVALKYMPIDSPGTHLIKHLDGDPSNCAVENLVWVSRSDNAKSLHRGKKRGITAYGSRWSANISNGGKTQYLGLHDTKEKAYEAFRIAFVEQNGVEPW